MTRQVISDRENYESCEKIIDTYVHKVLVYSDRIEVYLTLDSDAFNAV